jgi:hypothetical protein
MNKTETKKLIKKLQQAYTCCGKCGDLHGVYSVRYSSNWEGQCDVCGKIDIVTEARDYAYFVTGIRKLRLQMQANQTQDN